MIKKLHYQFNLGTSLVPKRFRLLAPMLIILLYFGGGPSLFGQVTNTPPFTDATEALTYDFNACASFSHDESFKDYSEFTPVTGNSCANISGGQIYRVTGNHSCTSDEHGTAGDAACFQSSTDGHYTADHDLAIRFDIELNGGNDKASRLDGISFKQLAPDQYLWNNTGITGSSGPNNYPTKFGIRVSKDGAEIMILSDLATTQSWYTSEFNFNHNEHFVVAAGATSTFTFELYSYAPVGNGASVSAWDLDDLKIFSSCEEECNLSVDAGEDQTSCTAEEYVLTANASNASVCSEIISSYKITDSNTEAGCFTADPGVIFQKGAGCQGIDYVWSAGDDLILNEYADNTASITGTVIDQNGRIATVNMELSDKENSGTTWNASCYLDGISGPETYYRSFIGAITVDGIAQSVGTRFNAHYILADGAGFDSSQYGLGAWTGGAFGECTEWFANLVPMEIENPNQAIEYLWSTGETTQSIIVTEAGEYTVTVSDCKGCIATDAVEVIIEDKVVIGDFVWLDENRNGLQDDDASGINDVKVTLYQCDGEEIASTMTADNADGEAGAYSFEVCPNSGEYYVVFGDVPDGMEFTDNNVNTDDTKDSDANENGRTECFEVTDVDDLSIDGGLIEICDINIDAGDDVTICTNETIEITADILDNTADCPGVCVYPIKDQERCYGPEGNYEVYLVSTGHVDNFKFKASEQKFERYADNTARYTATASNGKDVIKIDALYTGYTTNTPVGSPKNNACQQYDTSDWEYWTTWSGTITSENHGVFNLSVKEAAFQMGDGADVTRTGFGASGWFYVDGGDGFYSEGDVNVTIDPCVENGVTFKWITEDGNIVGNADQKTIKVDQPGTYIVEAVNCVDCFTRDKITVTKGTCNNGAKTEASPKMSTVYPIPVQSGGTLTIAFDIPEASKDNSGLQAASLKATVDFPDRKEDVTVLLYDMMGRVINVPRTYKIVNGKAVIYLVLDHIPSGKYILRAQGPNWSDAKNVLVK